MKIAHLISTFLPSRGGAEVCVHNLACSQTELGHMVKVIAPKKQHVPGLPYEVLPLMQGSVRLSMMPVFNKFYLSKQLLRYQKKYKFDVWQVTIGYPFGVAAMDFFKKHKIPCVLRCSGEDIQREPSINYGTRLHKGRDSLIRKHYPMFDGIISITQSITEDYIKLGIHKNYINYIPNGYNKLAFDSSYAKGYNIKANYNIDTNNKLILSIGRNHPKKGFNYIPRIIRELLKKRTDFIWLLVGKGNLKIKKIAQDSGIGKYLAVIERLEEEDGASLFCCPSKELIRIYKQADLFAFPTLIEGCSTVITEALAAGLPISSTDVLGVKDMIDHEKTGLLSKRGDPAGMALNIERLLNDKGLYEKIRQNSLAKMIGLDWPNIAERYINVYERTIRRKY